MMISTRGRYALRVLLDLAEHKDEGYIPMKEVAKRQELSLKYIERIMPVLSKNKLVEGVHGKGGGYRLSRPAEEYTVGEILRLTEGNLAPVSCLECDAKECKRAGSCKTLPMWKKFHDITNDYFDSITLAEFF
ncbi:MAG: RrF2 family transcriptional regulator [Clostridia bacterium]|nr:RrF2 family transcriptional regulator [Clostridia bacterium]